MAPLSQTLMALRDIVVTRGGQSILEHIDLDIHAGEIVTVVGPNGAGKSTLARVAAGLMPPDGGSVTRRPGLNVGYVPQDFPSAPPLPISVRRFLDLPCRLSDADAAKALDGMAAGHLAKRSLAKLSGGERQRVLIAMALAAKPDLLVLDEPAKGLDPISENDLYARLPHLRDEMGFGVLMISHDLHVVMAATDRVVCLNKHICCQGSPKDIDALAAFPQLFHDPETANLALYHHRPHLHRHDDEDHTDDAELD